MNILALDLGTATGWALLHNGEVTSGTWILGDKKSNAYAKKLRMDRRCDPRFLVLLERLDKIRRSVPLDWVVFEDVEFGQYRMQAHLWATWRAAVWCLAEESVQIDCLATGKLKHFATGNGGADKDKMARALTLDPRYSLDKDGVRDNLTGDLLDDNAVDAVHLLHWAMTTFK